MSRVDTIRECFNYNAWARDRLLDMAAGTFEDQLDRRFEMGCGSLRETLRHLYRAEHVWFTRFLGRNPPELTDGRDLGPVPEFAKAFRSIHDHRTAWLDELDDATVRQPITFDHEDETYTLPLDQLMLHVCNHGTHHRAQTLNMLRHVGVKVRDIDYIDMRHGRHDDPPPDFSVAMIRDYYAYNDWARDTVLDAASGLTDDDLDRQFEMGPGTLRKTLLHIRDAEQWWLENWHSDGEDHFTELDAETTMDELRELHSETAQRRDAVLARMTDMDLKRRVWCNPSPGETYTFRLGETMFQLCNHGTHHRAQVLNMLRHLGAAAPGLDYARWLRTGTNR